MKLTVEQVRHVANLARLSLTPDEEAVYPQQLSAILEAVEKLNALDTAHVEPTSHATLLKALLRDDKAVQSDARDRVLANAPASSGTSFAVPKILE